MIFAQEKFHVLLQIFRDVCTAYECPPDIFAGLQQETCKQRRVLVECGLDIFVKCLKSFIIRKEPVGNHIFGGIGLQCVHIGQLLR